MFVGAPWADSEESPEKESSTCLIGAMFARRGRHSRVSQNGDMCSCWAVKVFLGLLLGTRAHNLLIYFEARSSKGWMQERGIDDI